MNKKINLIIGSGVLGAYLSAELLKKKEKVVVTTTFSFFFKSSADK